MVCQAGHTLRGVARILAGLIILSIGIHLVVEQSQGQVPGKFRGQGWQTNFDKRSIDLGELSVNVPRDAIPPIDHPRFVSISEADRWMSDSEPVIAIALGGRARAYPLQILTWHEIVNDRVADVPVTVTFCPLCYSALAFDRRVEGRVLDFGVSGMLRHSDLVMYDRQTHSLWQQLSGEAIVGEYLGTTLKQVPAQIISFSEYRSAYPTGDVLSRDTGHQRQYGQNPYPGYDDITDKPWLFRGRVDDRLPPMERVVSVTLEGVDKAYPHSVTREQNVINDAVANRPVVVFHSESGATSALDRADISTSENIGSTGVFEREVSGRVLEFAYRNGTFVDRQTESVWDVTGRATSGELEGVRLTPVPHGDIFSFAWFVVNPESLVYGQ